jgi:hypothetical protein
MESLVDSKNLIGTCVCSEVPGCHKLEDTWVLLEEINIANHEILERLCSVLEGKG